MQIDANDTSIAVVILRADSLFVQILETPTAGGARAPERGDPQT